MEISQVTYGFNKDREGIEHLKWICDLRCVSQCLLKSHLSCLAINIYFVLNSAKVKKKKNGNVTVKNYLNKSLLSLLCFTIYGQGSFEKGLM